MKFGAPELLLLIVVIMSIIICMLSLCLSLVVVVVVVAVGGLDVAGGLADGRLELALAVRGRLDLEARVLGGVVAPLNVLLAVH